MPRVTTRFPLRHQSVDFAAKSRKISKSIDKPKAHGPREINKLLSMEERIEMIYLHEQHGMSENEISRVLGMKYVTVRAIIKMWKETGRINKLLPYSVKKQLLKNRGLRNARLGKEESDEDTKFCDINLMVSFPDPSSTLSKETYILSTQSVKDNSSQMIDWTNFTSVSDDVER